MFGGFGIGEILIIGIILLLLFGKRLPATMRSMGQSIVEFKKGIKDVGEENGDEENRSSR
jgi:sec-independent protein translocase protein TatA